MAKKKATKKTSKKAAKPAKTAHKNTSPATLGVSTAVYNAEQRVKQAGKVLQRAFTDELPHKQLKKPLNAFINALYDYTEACLEDAHKPQIMIKLEE